MAIAIGGYPRARKPAFSNHPDSFRDGFARALGYADRDDMEAGCLADLEDWHARVERANAVLCVRYGAEQCSDPAERGHILLTAALDEWAAAKSSSPEWPDDDSDDIARAMGLYEEHSGASGARA